MMKKLLLILAGLTATLCASAHTIVVKGTVKNVPDSTFIQLTKSQNGFGTGVQVDSIYGGKFVLKADIVLKPGVSYSLSSYGRSCSGKKNLWIDESVKVVEVTGDDGNIANWRTNIDNPDQRVSDQLDALLEQNPITNYRDTAIYSAEMRRQLAATYELVKLNVNRPPVLKYLYLALRSYSAEQLRELYALMTPKNQKATMGRAISEKLNPLPILEVGDKYADFEMLDSMGNTYRLSDFVGKGKYVMLDFWSNGCLGCFNSIPELNKFAKKYADKLELVGLNVHNEFVRSYENLKWTHKCEIEYRNMGLEGSLLVAPFTQYAFGGGYLPSIVMIDPEGMILLKGTIGVEKQIAEILDKQ